MLSDCLLAKINVDTAENEPSKVSVKQGVRMGVPGGCLVGLVVAKLTVDDVQEPPVEVEGYRYMARIEGVRFSSLLFFFPSPVLRGEVLLLGGNSIRVSGNRE